MPHPADRDLALIAALPSLTALLRHRAATRPDDRAYVALSDRGGEEVRLPSPNSTAAPVRSPRVSPSAPSLENAPSCLFPMIDFLVAFFGCLYAGVIAVPMMLPRRQSTRDRAAAFSRIASRAWR